MLFTLRHRVSYAMIAFSNMLCTNVTAGINGKSTMTRTWTNLINHLYIKTSIRKYILQNIIRKILKAI